jgi:Ca-activated chloride channel family protein
MKAARQFSSFRKHLALALTATLSTTLLTLSAGAETTQLLLKRDARPPAVEYKGSVDLTIDPGFEHAKVSITVDGQRIADNLSAPYKVAVDFGPAAVEHRIGVTVVTEGKKRIRWQEIINRGHLPLTVTVKPFDITNRVFEATTTAPKEDPISVVELWDSGIKVASVSEPPYRFQVPAEILASGFVQVTARTKSGEEAADFWSNVGDVHVESVQVRTVPIFVSVVDRNGVTRDDVDRSIFRVLDNENEAKIIEFGKAFDQPISIALLLDASASMTYSMKQATTAAGEFVRQALKSGDRCSVYAIQDVPRRKQALTADSALVAKALQEMSPTGQTALYDSIESALRELRSEKVRRALVVLTDGGDTASVASFDEIQKAAAIAGIPIYFIAYNTGTESSIRDLERMRHLAAQTGGFVATATQHNLQAKYTEIEKDLRAQFAILYQITDFTKQNEWRRVRVLLNSPKLSARTIRGYFAP